ncbi:hypothetical protein [Nocardiopsis chromatogenes]|uniref:hypothetical protein n=1 Tax=Nocardiopsis chromatogenes TaxID=280239 RepID=UPI001EF9F85C|nr:hypothetical protein [Nocardiopsis chromatogenes]
MSTDHPNDQETPSDDEAVDISGRPLTDLPDYQLLEDAKSMVTHAFTMTHALFYSDVTEERRAELERELLHHIDTKKQIPFIGREGWIDIAKKYPKINSDLKREINSHRQLDGE